MAKRRTFVVRRLFGKKEVVGNNDDSYSQLRKEAVRGMANAYPHKYQMTHSVTQLVREFEGKTGGPNEFISDYFVSVGGRIEKIRKSGSNLMFIDLRAEHSKVQVIFDRSAFSDQFMFDELKTNLRRGDVVGVTGNVGLSKTNEFSIKAVSGALLAPCLHMLPDYFGLTNTETRFRNRHIDLIVNQSTRTIFEMRAKLISTLRNEFSKRGFMEVETPTLNLIPGGANAKPFSTFHNDLKQKMSLRVSPELYLKTLIVGGFERIFEIGKCFRNEQIDQTHNPEFTSCEAYWAFADHNDMIKFTEEVIGNIVKELNKGSLTVVAKTDDGKEQSIDFASPFNRIDIVTELESRLGVSLPKDMSTESANRAISDLCVKFGVECSEPRTTSRLVDKLIGKFIEPLCVNPTFVTGHPQVMSPLAKEDRNRPFLTERFELFINGKEFVNGYTELNDPVKQTAQFEAQMKEKEKGNEEACEIDESYVKVLEYGLPPTAGWGLGIDRLLMLLAGVTNIQEVIFFPAMKPLKAAN